MHDQTREEETNQQGHTERDRALKVSGRVNEREEEQEPSDNKLGTVRIQNGPCHEEKIHNHNTERNRFFQHGM